jgi:homoserine dehydrogenase
VSVDVPVALLGYGTVGCAVDAAAARQRRRHRARDRAPAPARARRSCATPARSGSSRTRRADDRLSPTIRDDPSIAVVAEVMGGLEPTGDYVLELLRAASRS